ncbi:MAG: sn-glycerol-3-phosphate ABC transporter ATP-binding protein UgpC [Candidatus Firestonebacteria bacterium]
MAKVVLQDIEKRFPGNPKPAVSKFNLEVMDKEFVVFVGPSGCGKSTTLRMIAGLEEITAGKVSIDDKVVNDMPPKDRDVAMVFQNYALYPHMTLYDNMAFGLKIRKYPVEEIKRRVSEAAEILGIQDLLKRKPKQLSGGQRQRVALGRAIVRKPKVFLFDEPLSNLDAKLRVQTRTEIIKLHNRLQATMIYVTHDQVEAMTMGDRIVVMKDGLIQQVGDPINIYDNPANKFVAGFIGTPPMNFINGSIEKKDGGTYFNEGSFSVRLEKNMEDKMSAYAGKEVTLGVRPEYIGDKKALKIAKPEWGLSAIVDVVEPIGSESYVYFATGQSAFTAKVDSHDTFKLGEKSEIAFNMSKVHFFDKETEVTIV